MNVVRLLLVLALGSLLTACATVERAQSGPILVELHPSWESANDACARLGAPIRARGCVAPLTPTMIVVVVVGFAEDLAHEMCHVFFLLRDGGDPRHQVCRP